MVRQSGHRRDGFTLIELLVVISIIAILMGLTTAAVMRVKEAGTRTENGWRIDQVTIANDTFCSTSPLGPPNYLPPAPFVLKSAYNVNDPEAIYLKRLFPNMSLTATGLPNVTLVDGNQVMVFFLTGGKVTEYAGFSNNSQQPFAPAASGEVRRGPYLQLKSTMYATDATNGQARLIDPYGTPYAVFTAGPKGNYAGQSFTFNSTTVAPYSRGTSPLKYENPKTLQIISAGQDKKFGPFAPGGDWSAGAQGDGRDDKSNFSTATLGSGPQ